MELKTKGAKMRTDLENLLKSCTELSDLIKTKSAELEKKIKLAEIEAEKLKCSDKYGK